MTTIILIALAISFAVLNATTYNSTDWSPEEYASKEELKALEISRQLEIERQKAVILRGLGKTGPPDFANASRRQLPKPVIAMWMNYESLQHPTEPQENFAQLVIFPRNRELLCHWNGSSSCRRFEFVVSSDVSSPSEISVRRLENRFAKATVSVFYSYPRHEKETMLERKEFLVKVSEEDRWLSFPLETFEKFKFWMENETFAVEITGLPLDEAEPNLPFLKMRKDMEVLSRQRKSDLNNTRDRGCHRVPFNISFDEIGYGDWIVHPPYYEAYMCKGYCQHVQNHHENFMDHLFEKNKTLVKEYGRCWSTCCRPKTFATLSMIYRASNNTYVQTNMTDMIVTACSCT